jgi:hypothetical protein
MRTNRDQVGGILLVLVGAAAIVAALGAMGPVGIHSSPALWLLGAAGLVFGRLLLHSGLDLRGPREGVAVVNLASEPPSQSFGETEASSSQEQSETDWFAAATQL